MVSVTVFVFNVVSVSVMGVVAHSLHGLLVSWVLVISKLEDNAIELDTSVSPFEEDTPSTTLIILVIPSTLEDPSLHLIFSAYKCLT